MVCLSCKSDIANSELASHLTRRVDCCQDRGPSGPHKSGPAFTEPPGEYAEVISRILSCVIHTSRSLCRTDIGYSKRTYPIVLQNVNWSAGLRVLKTRRPSVE